MARIYISSTYNDLIKHRNIVNRVLRQMGHITIRMEYYVSNGLHPPLFKCLTDVSECDYYVAIIAWKYGDIPNDNNPEQLSFTELEYHKAKSLNKPCFIFMLDDQALWPSIFMDPVTEKEEIGGKIKKFRQFLKEKSSISFFKTPDELSTQVSLAIGNWEKEIFASQSHKNGTTQYNQTIAELLCQIDQLSSLIKTNNRESLESSDQGTTGRSIIDYKPLRIGERELSGKNQVVGLCSTGLDTGDQSTIHPDFWGKISILRSFPIRKSLNSLLLNPNDDDGASDIYSGIGTYHAGLLVGSGAKSISLGIEPIVGIAPEAKLIFHAVEQTPKWGRKCSKLGYELPKFGLFGIPSCLNELFELAYLNGARLYSIHFHSSFSGYSNKSYEIDEFIFSHQDFLVIVQSTNDYEITSTMSPGNAKNCLSTGNYIRGKSTIIPNIDGIWWPYLEISKDEEKDIFIHKPDVIVPQENFISVRSSCVSIDEFKSYIYPRSNKKYTFGEQIPSGGIIATGLALLIRQFLCELNKAIPSASLIKALIIHTTQFTGFSYFENLNISSENSKKYWGGIALKQIIDPEPPNKILFFDQTPILSMTGQTYSYTFYINESSIPLCATLVYTDYPGEMLVNNLNIVLYGPKGLFFLGNDFSGSEKLDHHNNVERIVINKPISGQWIVKVIASDIVHEGQSYSLVVSGGGLELLQDL